MEPNEEEKLDFERVCRLCVTQNLEPSDLSLICSSENPLSDLIKECVDILVRVEDTLPKQICKECLDKINSWKSFKNLCQQSENFLFTYYNTQLCSITLDDSSAKESLLNENCQPPGKEKFEDETSSCSTVSANSFSAEDVRLNEEDEQGLALAEASSLVEKSNALTESGVSEEDLSSVIRVTGMKDFKLLIDANVINSNRNLYRSFESQYYFACTEDHVTKINDNLLLNLEGNKYCEVDFITSGQAASECDLTSEQLDSGNDIEGDCYEIETISLEEADKRSLLKERKVGIESRRKPSILKSSAPATIPTIHIGDTETIQCTPDLSPENTISYIFLTGENGQKIQTVNTNPDSAILRNVLTSSNLNPILKPKNKSSSKKALMFHKYAKPAAEKSVKFLIPGPKPPESTAPPNRNLVAIKPKPVHPLPTLSTLSLANSAPEPVRGLKRILPETGVSTRSTTGMSTRSKVKKICLAPDAPKAKLKPPPAPSPPAPSPPALSPPAPSPPANSGASDLKTVDDITSRIEQIIQNNEQILGKTWGQYRREEGVSPGPSSSSKSGVTVRNKTHDNLLKAQEVKDTALKQVKVSEHFLAPLSTNIFVTAGDSSKPALAPKVPTQKLRPIKPKVTAEKMIEIIEEPHTPDDVILTSLLTGEQYSSSSVDPPMFADEQTTAELAANHQLVVRYTINEDGMKVPILVLDSVDGEMMEHKIIDKRTDWRSNIPLDQILDPTTLPKNKQRSKILQKFYLPKEPTIIGESSMDQDESQEGEGQVKDFLFWIDKIPDPPKDTNSDNPIDKIIGSGKTLRKRIRKKYKKKPKPKIYKCQLCDVAYVKFYELCYHDKANHADLPANDNCQNCGKCFIFEDRLQWHRNIYHAAKNIFCDLCGNGFRNKERLTAHLKSHSDKFVCDLCGYRASSNRKLSDHKRTHTGEKPFMCDICGTKLRSKVSLKQHMSKHTGENTTSKWYCKDCDFSTNAVTSFYHHRKRHEKGVSFLCEQCGQNVLTKSRLYKHMRFAHGPETMGHYECGECNGIYYSKTACDDHLKEKHKMTGEGRAFVCKLCFKSFATKAACKKHFRTHNL